MAKIPQGAPPHTCAQVPERNLFTESSNRPQTRGKEGEARQGPGHLETGEQAGEIRGGSRRQD